MTLQRFSGRVVVLVGKVKTHRIYITYDVDEVSLYPVNVRLWWRKPPKFFYDSKLVPVELLGYPKLTLVIMSIRENGTTKHDFFAIDKNFASIKDKVNFYANNINQYPDKKVTSINHLDLSVDG